MGAHTNKRLKKSPTSSVVEGPPMFIKTMAVGPFDPAEFCVTGGLFTEARHLADCPAPFRRLSGDAVCRAMLLESPDTDCRKAMATAASVKVSNVRMLFREHSKVEVEVEIAQVKRRGRRQLQRMLEECTESRDLQIARGPC